MATLHNSHPVLGVVAVDPSKKIHNGLPVIGVRVTALGFLDSKRTLGVSVLSSGATIYNDQRVGGVVFIDDDRNMFNGFEVIPVFIVGAVEPVLTAPSAMTAGQWTLADSPSAGGDKLSLNITALPYDGGSAITALQYSVGGGSAQTLSGVGTGERLITVLASTAASVELWAVNAIGAGARSVAKVRTPTSNAAPIAYDYLITSDATWTSTFALGAATLSGKTIAVRAGNYTAKTLSGFAPASTVTIAAEVTGNYPVFAGLTVNSSSANILFSGLKTSFDNSGGTDYVGGDPAYTTVVNSSTGIEFRGCVWDNNCATGTKKQRRGCIRATGSSLTLTNNTFTHAREAGAFNHSTITATGNVITHMYEDGFTGLNTDWTVDNNTFTYFQGDYGKSWFLTATTGTITVGETLSNGLSGTAQKVLYVAASDGSTYVKGLYNNFAKPVAGETYTGATGSITLGTEQKVEDPNYSDGIHGDAFQPINDSAATANRVVRARKNLIYRTSGYTFNALMDEQHVQGILAQDNNAVKGTPHSWAEVDISGNVIAGGQAIGITVGSALSGKINQNTIVTSPYGDTADIAYANCTNVEIRNNACRVMDVGSGASTGMTIADNVTMLLANQPTYLQAYNTYPHTILGLSPAVGSPLDTGAAGATDTTGVFRTLPMAAYVAPPPITTPLVLDASLTTGSTTSAASITMAFTAAAGSNRRVLVNVSTFNASLITTSLSATWGGVAMTKLAEQKTTSGTNAYEWNAMFELTEANFPSGATGNIVVTSSYGVSDNIGIEALTIGNIGAGSPVVASTWGNPSSGGIPLSITPAVAGSLVIGQSMVSVGASGAGWVSGLTYIPSRNYFGGTQTNLWGSAMQGVSALTCNANYTAGRGTIILLAYPPTS